MDRKGRQTVTSREGEGVLFLNIAWAKGQGHVREWTSVEEPESVETREKPRGDGISRVCWGQILI